MIRTVTPRLHERGRIRLGERDEKGRPRRLRTWRLTSQDRTAIEQAARLWGGAPERWESPTGEEWEVVTETDTLPVLVVPGPLACSSYLEAWSSSGVQRRCDGERELLSDQPCLCDSEEQRVCQPTTRLSVLLPDLPGVGVWRLESRSWAAAAQLTAVVDLLAQLSSGPTPCWLRIVEQKLRREGTTLRSVVPVLEPAVDLRQLAGRGGSAPALDGSRSSVELSAANDEDSQIDQEPTAELSSDESSSEQTADEPPASEPEKTLPTMRRTPAELSSGDQAREKMLRKARALGRGAGLDAEELAELDSRTDEELAAFIDRVIEAMKRI